MQTRPRGLRWTCSLTLRCLLLSRSSGGSRGARGPSNRTSRRPLSLTDAVDRRMNTICLLGLGYIGLPTGSMFALAGKRVIGVDPSPRVQAALANGKASIDEPELQTLVAAAINSGRLRVQTR